MQESVSHTIHHVAFAISNLFQQQHSEVIKPTKRLKSTIESTAIRACKQLRTTKKHPHNVN